MEAFRENVIRIIDSCSADRGSTEYDGQYREIANQIKELKKKKSKRIREVQLAKSYEQLAQDVDGYIKKIGALKRQFDDDLVKRLI